MTGFVSVFDVPNLASVVCPTNEKMGRRVDTQTVKAMLNRSLNSLRNVEYRFCDDLNCPTVYYSADGLQTFAEADLRERVYQKHPQEDDGLICYCFRHTVGDVLKDRNAGENKVVSEIDQGIKNGQCACDIRNPQGSCCLGNVRALVKTAAVKS